MKHRFVKLGILAFLCSFMVTVGSLEAQETVGSSYSPVVIKTPFGKTMEKMKAAKPEIMKRQMDLLDERYDLSDRPADGVMMSGGRKAVQEGVRVKLSKGMTWKKLAKMTPDQIMIGGFNSIGDGGDPAGGLPAGELEAMVLIHFSPAAITDNLCIDSMKYGTAGGFVFSYVQGIVTVPEFSGELCVPVYEDNLVDISVVHTATGQEVETLYSDEDYSLAISLKETLLGICRPPFAKPILS